jgi:hypothetical protein
VKLWIVFALIVDKNLLSPHDTLIPVLSPLLKLLEKREGELITGSAISGRG